MERARTLEGRIALVTGASGGIGGAIARRLADAGAAVAAGYGHSSDAAQAVVEDVVATGGRAVAVGADLRRADAAHELVSAACCSCHRLPL